MRKLSFFLLLATAAAPAFAQDSDRTDRQRGDRADQSESRSERANRPQRANRSQNADRPQRVESRRSDPGERRSGVQRSQRSQPNQQGYFEAIRDRAEQQRLQGQQAVSTQTGGNEPASNWRRGDRSGDNARSGTLRPRERQVRTIPNVQPNVVPQHRDRRGVESHRRDYRDGNYNRWSRNWHRDNRYDWRRYRDRNRSSFRLGFYYDPFGYNYRRWSVGSLLNSSYYGSRYWLNDPWQYRLPPAYGPYRWVRYWNDALLVNIYTGEVVDVIHSFFW
jgi:hypothetical protein